MSTATGKKQSKGCSQAQRRREQRLRKKLLSQYQQLDEYLRANHNGTPRPHEPAPDLMDMAADDLERTTSNQVGEVLLTAANGVGRALQKMAEGSYGTCDECGGRIPVARLRALPWAKLCVECQQRHERENSETPVASPSHVSFPTGQEMRLWDQTEDDYSVSALQFG
jgi:DnaK suppressor protein